MKKLIAVVPMPHDAVDNSSLRRLGRTCLHSRLKKLLPQNQPQKLRMKVDWITVGFAQVGHESDWRMASTNSVQGALSEDNGFDLSFVDCDNDSAAQLEAVRQFIQDDVDYIVVDPIVATGWDTVLYRS